MHEAWSESLAALGQVHPAIVTAVLAAVAVAAGVVAHALVMALLRRTIGGADLAVQSLLPRLNGPLRLAMVLLALNFAAAAAPMEPDVRVILAGALQLVFIAFVGWMLLTAVNIVADLYVRRFDVSVSDNLLARKQVTQVRVLKSVINSLIVVLTVAAALMSFEQVRQFGVSLAASAGLAGIVVGFAARPMLSNLIAGIQLAVTQPIRLDDAVIVENEWGWIEEITATYVVVRLWDWRRMVVPLTYFIEKPFQNWTRQSADLIGSVFIRADYSVPVEAVRTKLTEIAKASPLWDGRVVALQMTDADDRTVELRALVSAGSASAAFELRCYVREKLIDYIAREHPTALPLRRLQAIDDGDAAALESGAQRAEFARQGR